MKTSAVFLAMGAALTRAQAPGDVPINCAQANANYCMEDGSDIILRCDENAIGVPARCSPNLSGYPPSGGFATCWQSSEEAGDAACEKNVSWPNMILYWLSANVNLGTCSVSSMPNLLALLSPWLAMSVLPHTLIRRLLLVLLTLHPTPPLPPP